MERSVFHFLVFIPLYFLTWGIADVVLVVSLIYMRSIKYTCIVFTICALIRFIPITPSDYYKKFWHKCLTSFFPKYELLVPKETEKKLEEEGKKFVICCHPHGIFALSDVLLLTSPFMRKVKTRLLAANFMLNIPVLSIFSRLLGFERAWGGNMKDLMSKKQYSPLMLVPGGVDEMAYTREGKHDLYLKQRSGFIFYCVKFGYQPIPVFSFGETELYSWFVRLPISTPGRRYYSMIATILFNFVILRGWLWITSLPRRKNIYSFVGEPVDFKKIIGERKVDRNVIGECLEHYISEVKKTREKGIEMIKKEEKRFSDVEIGDLKIV